MWYSIEEQDPDGIDRFPLVARVEADSFGAQMCAEDYYHNHDGWDSRWPQTVVLYESETGPAIAKYLVSLDTTPVFYAQKVVDK